MLATSLGDNKGAGSALHELLDTLEPPLVTSLDLEDVELATRDTCCEEDVLATLATISSSCQHIQGEVSLSVLLNSAGLKDRCLDSDVLGKATLQKDHCEAKRSKATAFGSHLG